MQDNFFMKKGLQKFTIRSGISGSQNLRTKLGVLGISFLLIAGIVSVLKISATYTLSGHVFIDYNGDQIENGEDARLPIMKVNVYSDEDASGDLSAGDFEIDADLTDAYGNYSIEFSSGSSTFTTRVSDADDDAEEDTNDGTMYKASSDLEMFYDGGTHQKIGIRFDSVDLPKSAVITSAYLRFESKSSSAANTVNIYGELNPSARRFSSGNYNISNRSQTIQTIAWITTAWAVDTHYDSDDISAIINEIRNQTYWATNNPMAFILEGTSGTKNAYAGASRGPQLIINYTMPVLSNDFIIALDTIHLASGSTVSETPVSQGSASNQAVSYTGEGVLCFAVADEDFDQLMIINRVSGMNRVPLSGGATGATEIEALCFNPGGNTIYTSDGGTLGTLNLQTGAFTAKASSIGTGDGALGSITFSDIDGLTFDPLTGDLWASHRRNSASDLLLKIDTTSGQFIPDAFGAGVDYVPLSGTGTLNDVDDIAINPDNGKLYGTNNETVVYNYEFLVEIDKGTGAMSIIDTLKQDGAYLRDIEGFGFTNFGLLIGSTGDQDNLPSSNGLFEIDLTTATASEIGFFEVSEDFEGCDCLTGANNNLNGYVYRDANQNEVFDGGESVFSNNKLRIYIDTNQNGSLDGGDQLVDSILSDAGGYYSWTTASNLDFLIEIDTLTMPANHYRTGTGEEKSVFSVGFGGRSDPDNNFGILDDASFPVEWKSFAGRWLDDFVELSWETSLEINTSSFQIERSLDGNEFQTLDEVKAAGYSNEGKKYLFVDDKVERAIAPQFYYRLKQIDIDGQFEYSQTLSLQGGIRKHLDFSVFPNPATDVLHLNFDGQQFTGVQVKVLNQLGQQLISRELPDKQVSSNSFNVSEWAPGIYTFVLESEQEQNTRKVLIK